MKCKQVLIAFDQFCNTLCDGMADETLSARAWRCRKTSKKWAVIQRWIDRLFFWQPHHCLGAYKHEFKRSQLPSHYEDIKNADFGD